MITSSPYTSSNTSPNKMIDVNECIRQCGQVLNEASLKDKKEMQRLKYSVHYLSNFLFKTELKLAECEQLMSNHSSDKIDSSIGNLFLFFVQDQMCGLIIGSILTWLCGFTDQRLASHYCKKYGVHLNGIAKFLCPTIICLVQVVLRKRNKNSKTAAALSELKKKMANGRPNKRNARSRRPRPFKSCKRKSKPFGKPRRNSQRPKRLNVPQSPKGFAIDMTNALLSDSDFECQPSSSSVRYKQNV